MLVGNFLTNNPFGNNPFDTTIGSTLGYPLIINTDASGNITDVRTAFNNHAYAALNGSVYDACAGPVIELTLTNYFGIAIDFDANKQWNALLIALGSVQQMQDVLRNMLIADRIKSFSDGSKYKGIARKLNALLIPVE